MLQTNILYNKMKPKYFNKTYDRSSTADVIIMRQVVHTFNIRAGSWTSRPPQTNGSQSEHHRQFRPSTKQSIKILLQLGTYDSNNAETHRAVFLQPNEI
jgi:hypothetical protein